MRSYIKAVQHQFCFLSGVVLHLLNEFYVVNVHGYVESRASSADIEHDSVGRVEEEPEDGTRKAQHSSIRSHHGHHGTHSRRDRRPRHAHQRAHHLENAEDREHAEGRRGQRHEQDLDVVHVVTSSSRRKTGHGRERQLQHDLVEDSSAPENHGRLQLRPAAMYEHVDVVDELQLRWQRDHEPQRPHHDRSSQRHQRGHHHHRERRNQLDRHDEQSRGAADVVFDDVSLLQMGEKAASGSETTHEKKQGEAESGEGEDASLPATAIGWSSQAYCPGSPVAPDRVLITLRTTLDGVACEDVMREVRARVSGDNSWRDPSGGSYELLASEDGDDREVYEEHDPVKNSDSARATLTLKHVIDEKAASESAAPKGETEQAKGEIEDWMRLFFQKDTNQLAGCVIYACGEAQQSGSADNGRNYCNIHNLLCGPKTYCAMASYSNNSPALTELVSKYKPQELIVEYSPPENIADPATCMGQTGAKADDIYLPKGPVVSRAPETEHWSLIAGGTKRLKKVAGEVSLTLADSPAAAAEASGSSWIFDGIAITALVLLTLWCGERVYRMVEVWQRAGAMDAPPEDEAVAKKSTSNEQQAGEQVGADAEKEDEEGTESMQGQGGARGSIGGKAAEENEDLAKERTSVPSRPSSDYISGRNSEMGAGGKTGKEGEPGRKSSIGGEESRTSYNEEGEDFMRDLGSVPSLPMSDTLVNVKKRVGVSGKAATGGIKKAKPEGKVGEGEARPPPVMQPNLPPNTLAGLSKGAAKGMVMMPTGELATPAKGKQLVSNSMKGGMKTKTSPLDPPPGKPPGVGVSKALQGKSMLGGPGGEKM